MDAKLIPQIDEFEVKMRKNCTLLIPDHIVKLNNIKPNAILKLKIEYIIQE